MTEHAPDRPAISRRGRLARGLCVWTCASVLPGLGCNGEGAGIRSQRAEVSARERQNESLRGLIEATRERRLVSPEWLALAVDEAAVQSLIAAAFHEEVVVAGRYRPQSLRITPAMLWTAWRRGSSPGPPASAEASHDRHGRAVESLRDLCNDPPSPSGCRPLRCFIPFSGFPPACLRAA